MKNTLFRHATRSLACSLSAALLVLVPGTALAQFGKLGSTLDIAKDVSGAASLSDEQVVDLARQFIAYSDKKEKVAGPNDKYAKRLEKLVSKHTQEDGLKLNYKVYLSPTVNAFATADGSIRVYSGLMDLMTDDELMGIIGHEIGHVKLGHTAARMRTAALASAGRKIVAQSGKAGKLGDADLSDLGEKLLNAQFSQSNETESDDYGMAFLKRNGYNVNAMESAFRKLAAQGGGSGGLNALLSSHPDPAGRADRMKEAAAR